MTNVVPFPHVVVRALVIEQLNPHQWHHVLRGVAAPVDSLEALSSGVGPFGWVAAQAVDVADLTGLPVLVEPYHEPPRPLGMIAPSRAYWRHRFRRHSGLDHILYGSAGGGSA